MNPGPWRIFEDPIPGVVYLLCLDTSLGNPKLDPCAGHIFSLTLPKRQVATMHGHYSITEQARLTAWMGHVYNGAWHAVEDNHTGHAVILESIRLGARHVTRRWLDPFGKVKDQRYGISTSPRTKPQILEAGREEFVSGRVILNDVATIKELLVFKFGESATGKELIVSEENREDHRAMAFCLGMAAPRLTNLELPKQAVEEPKPVHGLLITIPDDPDHVKRRGNTFDAWGDAKTEQWGAPRH